MKKTKAVSAAFLPGWLVWLFNIVDRLFFPVPETGKYADRVQLQWTIENHGSELTKQIAACRTLEQTYNVRGMINNMHTVYGYSLQVIGWVDSLRLELYNKQKDIIEKM